MYTHKRYRDARYGTMRWRRLSKRVLERDLHVCRIVHGCPKRATVADHVIPAHPTMPDALFFAESNLRAGCRDHNLARVTEPLDEAAASSGTSVITGDFS